MTPYAVLLVKPGDTDEVIRKTYHELAKACHPDVHYDDAAKERWFDATAAYGAVKTAALRAEWAKKQKLMAGLCDVCKGVGVVGTRMFKGRVHICAACNGYGRG